MAIATDERALWIARHVLPHEASLRAHLGRWRLPPDLDADDVVQETYGRFASMDSVERLYNPRAYMFSVARSIVTMHLRRARIISIRLMEDADALTLFADEPSPETQVSDREQLHLLAEAVSALPEPGRCAFLLRVIDELPYREIGRRLNMSDNAVQKSVAKSLVRLMALLGRGGNSTSEASIAQESVIKDQHVGTRDERRD